MLWFGEHLITEVAAMKNDTLKKLKAMRLPAFADAYQKQIYHEDEYNSMSFHERLMLLVDAEYDSRHNNNIKRLIKNAKFSDSSAFLGVNACQFGYKTRYIRLPELFSELEAARIQGKYHQVMKQFQKFSLVILDEFLLIPASNQEQRDLLELMEYRCGQVSTIFCSQFMPEGWHERLGGSALADSILDRIIPSAYTMRIDGDVSMRQRKRIIKG